MEIAGGRLLASTGGVVNAVVGRDSVEVPGRANFWTEGSRSSGLSACRNGTPIVGCQAVSIKSELLVEESDEEEEKENCGACVVKDRRIAELEREHASLRARLGVEIEMLEDAEAVVAAKSEMLSPDVNVIAEIQAIRLEDNNEMGNV